MMRITVRRTAAGRRARLCHAAALGVQHRSGHQRGGRRHAQRARRVVRRLQFGGAREFGARVQFGQCARILR